MRKTLLLLAALPLTAHAHHFMGGGLPQTWMQGLLSGLGHPVVEADHAAFIIAIGFLLALVDRGLWALVAIIAGGLCGAALHLAGVGVPGIEAGVALSVLIAGVLLALRRRLSLVWMSSGLAVAGVLHGYAYAETIFGAEPGALAAYLFGFSIMQLVLASLAFVVHRHLIASRRPALASGLGAVTGLLGTVFLALSVLP
jgi:urease accessory protein